MTVVVFMERADDELSRQALTLARSLESDVRAVTVEGPYAPGAWARAIVEAAGDADIVGPGSDRGNEVLAHIAAQLDLPLAANVTEVRGDELTRIRWGGTLLEEARLHAPRRLMSAAPFAFPPGVESTETRLLTVDLDGAVAVVDHVAPDTGGKVSLADAKVVVSGGRGVGSAEGFAILEELAALLDAAVGCSRVVTSAGWRPHTDQVGQTGTKVSPDLYIACGISGATQHIAGCKGAKKLLAINADHEATIFAHADYAVIGDLHEIVPAITAELRKARSS
ncbi:MAG TPA: electron transfer flavoprotein subunit alpha/FixB family protein [Gaiellaceae bacterium]|nr:electron transfer flavoprotein subunit alpha/FixB family protein [Gaiellaceae bacterium]